MAYATGMLTAGNAPPAKALPRLAMRKPGGLGGGRSGPACGELAEAQQRLRARTMPLRQKRRAIRPPRTTASLLPSLSPPIELDSTEAVRSVTAVTDRSRPALHLHHALQRRSQFAITKWISARDQLAGLHFLAGQQQFFAHLPQRQLYGESRQGKDRRAR